MPPDDDPVLRFDPLVLPGPLIRRCQKLSEELYTDVMGGHRLTQRQLALMISVYQHAGTKITDHAVLTGIDRNTITEMANRLVARSLVTKRRPAGDGRAWTLYLTADGEKQVRDHIAGAQAVQERILRRLPENERGLLIKLLRHLLGVD